MKNQNISRR